MVDTGLGVGPTSFPVRGRGLGDGGGGASDVKIATVRVPLRTTTGTQDITIPGFGTPKAAYFICSHAFTDAVAFGGAFAAVGAADGVNQWVSEFESYDNDPGGQRDRRGMTDHVIMVGSVAMRAAFNSWITDGVRIDVTMTNGSAPFITVILFGGNDLSAKAGIVTPSSTDGVPTTVTTGFQANAIITGTVDRFIATSTASDAYMRLGFGSYDGTTIRQVSTIHHVASTTSATNYTVASNGISCNNGATVRLELANITATSFDVIPQGGFGAVPVGYLAIELAGAEVWAGIVDSPIATGNHDFAEPGFAPHTAILLPTVAAEVDTHYTDSFAFGLSAITVDAQYSTSWAEQDNVGTSNTQCVSDDQAVNLDKHDGTDGFEATFDSFLPSGMRLNFPIVDPTVRKWPALFIG